MLSLQNISKRFDGKPALSALSLDIHEGEFVVLVVMVNTGGNKRQVPAKRQNRGSRNSTDDGG